MAELHIERRGRVAVLTLHRPEHGNRLTALLAREVVTALAAARDDPDIGACVLTGAGDVFCLGGDWRGAGSTVAGREEYAQALVDMDSAMTGLGKPLIAAVNGDAHAGGFATAIACDLAVAADDATLGLPEAANGLFPFIALAIVKDALPKAVLFDLIYRARLMPAAEACAARVVSEVVPRAAVLERAVEIAEQAAAHSPEIVALGRDLYYRLRGMPATQALEAARQTLLAALAAADRS
jgi:enoyl-CoA hydratase/carnithine racemase